MSIRCTELVIYYLAQSPSGLPTLFWRYLTIHSERSPLQSIFILRVVPLSSESDSIPSTAKSSAMHILASRSGGNFPSFPVELLTSVFCHLFSFREVFILSCTCHQLRDVWPNNVATIFNDFA